MKYKPTWFKIGVILSIAFVALDFIVRLWTDIDAKSVTEYVIYPGELFGAVLNILYALFSSFIEKYFDEYVALNVVAPIIGIVSSFTAGAVIGSLFRRKGYQVSRKSIIISTIKFIVPMSLIVSGIYMYLFSPSIRNCSQYQKPWKADLCYDRLAESKRDPSLCHYIKDTYRQGWCIQDAGIWYDQPSSEYSIKYPSEWKSLYPESDEGKRILSYYSDVEKNLSRPLKILINISDIKFKNEALFQRGRKFIRLYRGILSGCNTLNTYKERRIENKLVLHDKYICTDNYTLGLTYMDTLDRPLSEEEIKAANAMLERITSTFIERN